MHVSRRDTQDGWISLSGVSRRSYMKRMVIASIMFLGVLALYSQPEAANYVFVTLEFPPLEYTGVDGNPKGIAVDMVKRIMSSLGHTVQIRVYPWPKALEMVRNGDADAIFTAYKTPERETFLDYSTEVLVPQIVGFYVKKGSPITFNGDLRTLRARHIGVVSTISYGPKFDQMRTQLQVEHVDRIEQNFQKLLSDRIDLMISNIHVADWELQKLQLREKIVRLPHEVERLSSYIAFSKQRSLTTLRDQFDQELRKLKANGEYDEVIGKYGIEIHP
jgi:polar amino acid transport system substrate-binding protein